MSSTGEPTRKFSGCAIWIESGKRIRESTLTQDWQEANRKLRERLLARDDKVLDIVRKGEQIRVR